MEFSMALQPGTVVKSPQRTYRIEKVLGQGGFGITYLAMTQATVSHAVNGQQKNKTETMRVALKEFFMEKINGRSGTQVTNSTGNETFQKYFIKFAAEADNLKSISHPNIIKVLERFSANGTQYYSMEYIDGGTLDDYIARRKGLPESESVALIGKIGRAIQFMHNKRMLHLDLKPKNVMMRRDGTPVVIDFGLSKLYDEKGNPETHTTIGAGTHGFAPIEQVNAHGGRNFPTTIDVYALGATLYMMLTNQFPASADEVLNNGLDTAPLRRKGVDVALIGLIADAMHPLQKKRIQTVDAFLARLPEATVNNTKTVELISEEDGNRAEVTNTEAQESGCWVFFGFMFCVALLLSHIFMGGSLGITGYLTSIVAFIGFLDCSWSRWQTVAKWSLALLLIHYVVGGITQYGFPSDISDLGRWIRELTFTKNFYATAIIIFMLFLSHREERKSENASEEK